MVPLAKYRACLFGFLGTAFLFGCGMLYFHVAFIVPFFANVLFWSYVVRRVGCLSCGASLAPDAGSSFVEILKSFYLKECAACGAKLDVSR